MSNSASLYLYWIVTCIKAKNHIKLVDIVLSCLFVRRSVSQNIFDLTILPTYSCFNMVIFKILRNRLYKGEGSFYRGCAVYLGKSGTDNQFRQSSRVPELIFGFGYPKLMLHYGENDIRLKTCENALLKLCKSIRSFSGLSYKTD